MEMRRNDVPRHGPALTGAFVFGLVLVYVAQRVVGESGTARTLLLGLGLALSGGALVLRLLTRGRAPEQAQSIEGLMAILYGVGLLGLGVYGLSTPEGLDLLGIRESESAEPIRVVLAVAWAVLISCSIVPVIFVELSYAGMPVAGAVEPRRIMMSAASGLTAALALIYLLAINYTANVYEVRRDVTYFKVTEASESTVRMIEQLDEPVEVVLFYADANEVLDQIQPYFDQLGSTSERLKVRVTDHVLEPALAKEHRIRGNGHILVKHGEQGETFEIGTKLESARRRLKRLDSTFQQHFMRAARPGRVLYVTTGHGERTGSARDQGEGEGITVFEQVIRQLGAQKRNLGLSQGLASEVPEEATAVAIIGPTERLLDEEVAALQRYAEGGGRLLILPESGVDDGLDPLLATLGLGRGEGTLVHERHHLTVTNTMADRGFILTNRFSSHPTVTTVQRTSSRVAMVFAGAGHLTELERNDPRISVIIRSMDGGWADRDGDLEHDRGEESRSTYNIGAAVTTTVAEGDEGRAVVIADADVLSDRLMGSKANADLSVDTLRWLIGDEDVIGETTSEEDIEIDHTRDQDVLWFWGTTILIPLAVLALGILVSMRRRGRRRRSSP